MKKLKVELQMARQEKASMVEDLENKNKELIKQLEICEVY